MTHSSDQLIKEGHRAIRRGDKGEARRLLQEAARQNPADHRAWLGLAAVAHTPRESLTLIDKAAEIKPDNPAVHQARKWAEGLAAKQVKAAPQPQPETKARPTGTPVRETALQERLKNQKAAPAPQPIPTPIVHEVDADPVLTMRRVIGAAAVLGIIIAVSLAGWFAYSTWWGGSSPVNNNALAPVSTPTAAEIALLPEITILPEVVAAANADANNLREDAAAAVVEATATPNPIQAKNIIQEAGEPRLRWTVTPLPTLTPTPSPTWFPTFVSPLSAADIVKPVGLLPNERWIDVSLSTQSLVAYEGDTPVFETLVSSGLANHPTVTGQFRIWLRFPAQTMDGTRLGYDYYLEDVPYVQYFFEDYALHGTYWHSNFGRPMSHGCVNLSTPDAEWLYNFADYGTVVTVHE
jgi:lipoprotein-anchoring transpeptidase ErfK/SrfK